METLYGGISVIAEPTPLLAGHALFRNKSIANPSEVRPVVPLWWILNESVNIENVGSR